MSKISYLGSAAYIEAQYGIVMQQRRGRFGSPKGQYQLAWSEVGSEAIHYAILKPGLASLEIIKAAQHIAATRPIVKEIST